MPWCRMILGVWGRGGGDALGCGWGVLAGWGDGWGGRWLVPVSFQDARFGAVLPSSVLCAWAHSGSGRYDQNTQQRRPYPDDLSDVRWELIEPVLAAWRCECRGRALDFGRPPEHDLREIMDAILYVDRTGVQWRYLPHDFPPWETVYGYFAKWQKEGIFAQLNGLLQELVRCPRRLRYRPAPASGRPPERPPRRAAGMPSRRHASSTRRA